ncbi:UNVERIFIED_ORG: alkylation response protein AidB-like acyl-CoA dehydrogenase [Xanthobacter viscosus]|uniref:3-methylmercaptopropionyl-CoA dehydrogenase n=1 Tax=Xanthobacter autotrophicus TaxID=280 RepID=A0A6C1KSB8_XANAU|nr:acyl-CoA dehydrogenase [Xanthobacter autotrophicus]TLX41543.1 acyl-CoA dehydrogenase [Xanthobacter autotrophicus]
MSYRAPVEEVAFFLKTCTALPLLMEQGLVDLSFDVVDPVLEEAGKFAASVIAPLDKVSDKQGCTLKDGAVTTPEGWRAAYEAWTAAGWSSVAAEEEFGGQHLPTSVTSALTEFWNSASPAFGIGGVLTMGAIEALTAHGSPELQQTYLTKMVAGTWTGTMNLTESQAGSDLAALRAKAVKQADGTYRVFGTKIFISYGEHDIAENIVHLVLARLPDAPAGTRGISLFLVPKVLVNADGSLGERNDVVCAGIEHKLGLHGSPTCTMVFGEKGEGAIGYLVGEENRGLACMFTMMNNARLAVGIQGVAVAERATQRAFAYAKDRRQGKAAGFEGSAPIIAHPDVKRMLLTMRAETDAARAICLKTADALDRARRLPDPSARAAALAEASLLTPVAKAFSTDIGIEVASTGVQVHGGMGYVEETGAAQHMRDARIFAIYEGTNGIQAIDLVTRKLPQEGGDVVNAVIADYRDIAAEVAALNSPDFGHTGVRLAEAIDALARATLKILDWLPSDQAKALAGATPYLRLFARAAGGAYLAKVALAAYAERAAGGTDPRLAARIALARFFAENLATEAKGLEESVTSGANGVLEAEAVLAVA